jgi:hypothetical protein
VRDTTPAAPSVTAPVGPYYALIIGNNEYQHVGKLETAVNDAEEVAQVLKERFGFKTTVIPNATRAQIITALDDYRQLPEKSNLLIYYGGHGHKDVAVHRTYWLPVDAEKDHTSNWINAVEITDAIRAIPSMHVLVIADSCFSGDLPMRSSGARISPKEHNALLSNMLRMKSRHVMSSGGDEPVADAGTGGHSVFAAALLQSLGDIEPDAFTGEELLTQWVKPRVVGRSSQTPQYIILREGDGDLGDFVFFRLSKSNGKDIEGGITADLGGNGEPVGVIEVFSVTRGSIYIDGKEMGQIFENGRKIFQRQAAGKHLVQLRGTAEQSQDVVVESGAVAYATFRTKAPIDNTGAVPVGKLLIQSEQGLDGEVYVDDYRVGHLDKGGYLTISNLIAGNHDYAVVEANGTKTAGSANITANNTTSLSLAPLPPTNLRVVVH